MRSPSVPQRLGDRGDDALLPLDVRETLRERPGLRDAPEGFHVHRVAEGRHRHDRPGVGALMATASADTRATAAAPVLSLRDAELTLGGRVLWSGLDLDVAP